VRQVYETVRPGVRLGGLGDGPETAGRCGFFWLGGFRSDMTGTKAEAVAALARGAGRHCLRFDYSGHGASGGDFLAGTITLWLEEALRMFRAHAPGPRVVIGSSMGGWLAALMLRALGTEAERVRGLVLVAPAHDFTETLMWPRMSPMERGVLMTEGVWMRPSEYGEPIPVTAKLIEDGRHHLLLGKPFPVACPVRILQGDADSDVPWSHAKRVFDDFVGEDIVMTLVKGGDHRLSEPHHLELLNAVALDLAQRAR
jgi:pimeloyl-ACP methyl ester carboxylesterase